jgi:hypothetical protein
MNLDMKDMKHEDVTDECEGVGRFEIRKGTVLGPHTRTYSQCPESRPCVVCKVA